LPNTAALIWPAVAPVGACEVSAIIPPGPARFRRFGTPMRAGAPRVKACRIGARCGRTDREAQKRRRGAAEAAYIEPVVKASAPP